MSIQDTFETLLRPHRAALRGYVQRLVGNAADADDLTQDSILKAFTAFDTLKNEAAFKAWLYRIATHRCLDHLRKKKRWRPLSQVYLERECQTNDAWRGEVSAQVRDPAFAFDVREHIALCFHCVGRSLPPTQHAAIVLRELLGYSNREAADILELTESVLRHHLSAGRRSMEQTFEGLCSLVSKDGVCRQCASFRQVTREERRGPSLPVLGADPWRERVDVARATHFAGGAGSTLHEVLLARIEDNEPEAPHDPAS